MAHARASGRSQVEICVHRLRARRQFNDSVHRVTVDKLDVCGACGARCPTVIYHKARTPLRGETAHVRASCDDLLNPSIELAREGVARGGGRGGRGGRGRGRGRKPPSDHDQKMSFKDF